MKFSFSWSAGSNLKKRTAYLDTKFETGTKTALLQPFSPIVVAADENERIRQASL
jgi:regulator-associated protein of mTOR